jgi:hypothetical protein
MAHQSLSFLCAAGRLASNIKKRYPASIAILVYVRQWPSFATGGHGSGAAVVCPSEWRVIAGLIN